MEATDTLTVTFVEEDGTVRTIDGIRPRTILKDVAKASGVAGIYAECGGQCMCATCHVYVDESWIAAVGGPGALEADMLDLTEDMLRPNSRLACQIVLAKQLDGLRVTVAPRG